MPKWSLSNTPWVLGLELRTHFRRKVNSQVGSSVCSKDRLYPKTGRILHLLNPGSDFQLLVWACVTGTVITTLNTLLLLRLWLLLFPQTLGGETIDGLKEARGFMFCVSCPSSDPGYSQKYAINYIQICHLHGDCICHIALRQKVTPCVIHFKTQSEGQWNGLEDKSICCQAW